MRYVVILNRYGNGTLGDAEVHGYWDDREDAEKYAEQIKADAKRIGAARLDYEVEAVRVVA